MAAWQFAKALYTSRQHGWTQFVSVQNHLNVLYREEERETLPLCADQGVGGPEGGGSRRRCGKGPRRTRAQIALAWLLQKSEVTAPIIGATKPHHLDDAVAALSLR